jgi:hypothetical protein
MSPTDAIPGRLEQQLILNVKQQSSKLPPYCTSG